MKHFFIVTFLLLCGMSAATLCAQPQTVRALSSSGVTTADGHLSAVMGQPLSGRFATGNYELSLGVVQAQLMVDSVYGVVTYNAPYLENNPPQADHDFVLGPQTESHVEYIYLVNGGIYNYDLLRKLFLIVCPHHLGDQANISYEVLEVSGHCWTKQNLRTPVAGAMAYSSEQTPTAPQEYGLLYTWQTALNGTSADEDGYVQGICPAQNWHLPDATEISRLMTNPADTLRSVDGWITPNGNTHSTDFTAYPAGLYNSTIQRFEGFGSETDWWMVNGTTVNATPTRRVPALQIPYYCDSPIIVSRNPNDAISVRYVMKNIWPEE